MFRYQKFYNINFILVIIFFLILTSCSTKKDILYFQEIDKLANMSAPEHFEPKIEVNDILQIDVSSMDQVLVAPFTMYGGYSSSSVNSGGAGVGSGGSQDRGRRNSGVTGYLVNSDGTINFPVLGNIEVEGKLRSQLEDELTQELREYVTDAVVRVRIINFSVTVLGETGSSVLNVVDERISVPQAIAMSGDITYDGRRDNILVIRTVDGKMEYGRVDLTNADIFQNPYFYLKQNDIIYVEPTYRQVKSAGFITSWQGLVSVITTAFSLFVFLNR